VDYIEDLKSEYISSNTLKIAATIKYDSEEITHNILEVLQEDINKLTNDAAKREQIKRLIHKSTELVLTHTTEIIKEMEEDIREEFPYVTEIDLEQSEKNIRQDYMGLIPLSTDEQGSEQPPVNKS
jgi:hypothetical protein